MSKLVMIVDDHQDIVDSLKMVMEGEGYKTDFANDGQQLLDKLKTVKPDLVLLDVMMPGLTTKQILDAIKKNKKTASIKIIIVTVVRFTEDEKKALFHSKNVVDYISKPLNVDDLIKATKKVLK